MLLVSRKDIFIKIECSAFYSTVQNPCTQLVSSELGSSKILYHPGVLFILYMMCAIFSLDSDQQPSIPEYRLCPLSLHLLIYLRLPKFNFVYEED